MLLGQNCTLTEPSALAVKSLVSVASWAKVVISEFPWALANWKEKQRQFINTDKIMEKVLLDHFIAHANTEQASLHELVGLPYTAVTKANYMASSVKSLHPKN